MKNLLLKSVFCFSFFGMMCVNAQTIDLTVTNLESNSGQIVLGIYKDQETWNKETPYTVKNFPKGSNVWAGTLKVSFTLPPGTYGLSMLDDSNKDDKMNYNWMGLPKEGFGFGNLYHTGWSKPKFNDFSVTLAQGQRVAVTIKVRYL